MGSDDGLHDVLVARAPADIPLETLAHVFEDLDRENADLRELLGNELLENQNAIIGEILHGREHAREGLVIWPAGNLEVNEVSLFVAGTSGETVTVKNPITGKPVLLRKTLQRDYLIPGEALARGSRPAGLVREQWVMR